MRSRAGALSTLVASLVLLAACLGLLLTTERGVGLDIARGTAAEAVPDSLVGEGLSGSQERPVGLTDGNRTVPRRDATRIEPLAEVPAPVEVSIPSLGVTMPIVSTGVRHDGQMELPDDPAQIGWYRFGTSPGDPRGSAVLGGHVDSERYGVGPLARLSAISPGARIVVTDADARPITYSVTKVERISKAALPTDRLFDPDSRPRLVLITCGGRYLPDAGGYEDNIVVIARPA